MTETDKREINKNHVAAWLCPFQSAEVLWGCSAKHDASSCQFWRKLETDVCLWIETPYVSSLFSLSEKSCILGLIYKWLQISFAGNGPSNAECRGRKSARTEPIHVPLPSWQLVIIYLFPHIVLRKKLDAAASLPIVKQDHWAQAEKNQNEEENTEISARILRAKHVQWYVTVWGGNGKGGCKPRNWKDPMWLLVLSRNGKTRKRLLLNKFRI